VTRFDALRILVEDRGRLRRNRTFYTVNEYVEWLKKNPE
jgi:hypothetical protein